MSSKSDFFNTMMHFSLKCMGLCVTWVMSKLGFEGRVMTAELGLKVNDAVFICKKHFCLFHERNRHLHFRCVFAFCPPRHYTASGPVLPGTYLAHIYSESLFYFVVTIHTCISCVFTVECSWLLWQLFFYFMSIKWCLIGTASSSTQKLNQVKVYSLYSYICYGKPMNALSKTPANMCCLHSSNEASDIYYVAVVFLTL